VISAVGHETDFTICDFVADLRAPTPSAAAEMAVPDAVEFRRKVNHVTDHMALLLRRNLERSRKHLELLSARRVLADGEWIFRDRRLLLDSAAERMERRMERLLTERKSGLAEFVGKLEALSPLAILSRGYGVISDETGALVRSVGDVEVGDGIVLRLADGALETTVKSKKEI
jgi:exodeoxyribonuclease VII large subunit